ncbi:hypothetical protein [Biformimicrobium ophioploci]|uniref:Uncharacterized protein n=1 Tax=Biformimicrobium ophioploci TaxID=3036711 RepID=A0ABQ6M0M7_9GAMM|nr:hypothetical protein [Microbulbifer sp. NKW57]GMG87830.1 hypothetical protein MNKW57_21510 [Microbulbifer sp. NKW57]
MKPDAMTIAVIVFVAGVLLTGVGKSGVFASEPQSRGELQQGVVTR